MRSVPREAFLPAGLRARAYDDGPLGIGAGQTISQPYVVALMIEQARIKPGDRLLEVGADSGYAAAVLWRIAAGFSRSSGTRSWPMPPPNAWCAWAATMSRFVRTTEPKVFPIKRPSM